MDDADRPAVVTAWIECKFCGRIEKAAQAFNLPDEQLAELQEFRRPMQGRAANQ